MRDEHLCKGYARENNERLGRENRSNGLTLGKELLFEERVPKATGRNFSRAGVESGALPPIVAYTQHIRQSSRVTYEPLSALQHTFFFR